MSRDEAIPIARPVSAHWAEAVQFLEQSVRAGCRDPHVYYMLAMGQKRLGKSAEARESLKRIAEPDANVHLQLGLLAYRERDFGEAEKCFTQSLQLDPSSYPAGYNLLLSRLSQGDIDACLTFLPQLSSLVPSAEEGRFLAALQGLLESLPNTDDGRSSDAGWTALVEITPRDELRLIELLGGLGQFPIAYPLLSRLADARPQSAAAQDAYLEVLLLQGKNLMDRCQWEEARTLLGPLGQKFAVKNDKTARATHVTLLNMLGCCSAMVQDFEMAVWYFTWALAKKGDDAFIHQNLALCYEWQGRNDHAERHWNSYLDLLPLSSGGKGVGESVPAPNLPNYHQVVAFEALIRLADNASKKEKWTYVLSCLQRALRLRPDDFDTLERVFHLCSQLKKTDEAKKALRRMRELRPSEPQFELLEFDLRDVRTVDDIDRLLGDVRRVLNKHANDMRIGDRATVIVNSLVPVLRRMCDQLTEQLNKVADQVRRLPSYQINWRTVREVLRELQDEYLKVRRLVGKCSQAVSSEETRRTLKDITQLIDRKLEMCQSIRG